MSVISGWLSLMVCSMVSMRRCMAFRWVASVFASVVFPDPGRPLRMMSIWVWYRV